MPQLIGYMLENGLDPNQTFNEYYEDYEGETSLLAWSIDRSDIDLTRLLLEKGAKLESIDGTGEADYSYSLLSSENIELLKLFLDKGWDINKVRANLDGNSMFTQAIANKDEELMKLLIGKKGDLYKEVKGIRPINVFLETGKIDLIKLALDSGADINGEINLKTQETLLMWAVNNNNFEFVKYLIDKKADLDKVSAQGKTALITAVEKENISIVEALVKAGVDTEFKDNFGKKAIDYTKNSEIKKLLNPGYGKNILIIAILGVFAIAVIISLQYVKKSKQKVFEYIKNNEFDKALKIIKKGIKPNLKDTQGRSLLFYVIDSNNSEILQELITKGFNLNQINEKGDTALHYAIFNHKTLLAKMLIENGANINARNMEELDTIALAIINNNVSLAEELVKKEINLYGRYGNEKTLLHLASENNSIKAMKYLLGKNMDKNLEDAFGKKPINYAITEEAKTILENQ